MEIYESEANRIATKKNQEKNDGKGDEKIESCIAQKVKDGMSREKAVEMCGGKSKSEKNEDMIGRESLIRWLNYQILDITGKSGLTPGETFQYVIDKIREYPA